MQTSITESYLNQRDGQEADRILRNCVHCGFCNATCPTYQLLGDELDGPRGRIYLIKQVLEGHKPGKHTQKHLDRCLTCRNCETTCPSGVEYSKLLDTGRQLVADKVRRPLKIRLFRFILRRFLLTSKLFSTSIYLGQVFRKHLPKDIKRSIPEKQPKLKWPTSTHSRKILLVQGCVQPSLIPSIDYAAAKIFDQGGVQCLYIKASSCCGALSHHLDARHEAHHYIKRNIDSWWPYIESGEIEAVTMTASGCGIMIKDYAHHLAGDRDYADKAAQISMLYKDPAEIIQHLDNIEIPTSPKPRVVFHPPCTLQHGLKLNGIVESILTRLGYELVDFENKHLCCGSAGTYSITQKTLSSQLRKNKLKDLQSNHPDIIVTANIGCQLHLQRGTNIPVRHWLELIA